MERLNGEDRTPQSIQEILNERARLEKLLKEKFTKQVAVMFTDIKGSTQFFETHGDLAGREMINKHNTLLFPIVERQGKIVKTIGDAIMAYFDNPEVAVKTAIEMQKALQAYNRSTANKIEEIHIRIGINYGAGIVEEKEDGTLDVYGDVVNTAARVEAGGGKKSDQILISRSVYEAVRNSEEIICRHYGSIEAKGKAEPLDIYRVVWDPELEEVLVDTTTRSAVQVEAGRKPRLGCMLIVSREGNQLRVTAYERMDHDFRTVQQHETTTITDAEITTLFQNVMNILAEAKAGGKVSKDKLIKLRSAGRAMYDQLLTPEAKKLFRVTRAEDLMLILDDQLIQLPWELMYDGEQFFCQKFNMGRLVRTSQTVSSLKVRSVGRPLKMMIIADPTSDLPAARQEGLKILSTLENEDQSSDLISARLQMSGLKVSDVLSKMSNFDIVHYAGHADYDDTNPSNSGWLMKDGKLRASSVVQLGKEHLLPSLVFSNSCISGQTEEWKIDPESGERIFGMASAFLLAGVQHYIGTFWEVLDEPSSHFALKFYQEMLAGKPVGEAVRKARMSLIDKYGEETIVWASYMLYGNPGFRYLGPSQERTTLEAGAEPKQETVEAMPTRGVQEIESPELVTSRVDLKEKKISKIPLLVTSVLVGLALILLLIVAYKFWPSSEKELALYEKGYMELRLNNLDQAQAIFERLKDESLRYAGLAAIYYEKKNYDEALKFVEQALEKNPENRYAPLIKGNVLLENGETEEAAELYRQVLQFKGGTPWQLAITHNRLGRILAAQGKTEEALKEYDQAISLNVPYSEVYSNKGVLLAKLSRTEEAMEAYQRALQLNPKDAFTQTLFNDIQQRKNEATDQERQKRIQALVADLAQRYREGKFAISPEETDPWTSKPVTLSLMPFEIKGAISLQDGEEEFLTLQLTNLLQETGRIVVVERRILENLLQELQLGSSELADQTTALKLGRLLGARLITTGTLTRRGGISLINLRLVETETTTIKGAFSEKLRLNEVDEGSVQVLVQRISEKIKKDYPLKGLVVQAEDESAIVINIGTKQGVTPGTMMTILKEGAAITSGDKILGYEKEDVGLLEITSVEEALSRGKVLKKTGEIERGMKVEEAAKET